MVKEGGWGGGGVSGPMPSPLLSNLFNLQKAQPL